MSKARAPKLIVTEPLRGNNRGAREREREKGQEEVEAAAKEQQRGTKSEK